MATVYVDPGTETYWLDGLPFDGIRNFKTMTGSQTYWLDGVPETSIFQLTNQDTGKFFMLFE